MQLVGEVSATGQERSGALFRRLGVERPLAHGLPDERRDRLVGKLLFDTDERDPVADADVPEIDLGEPSLLHEEPLDVGRAQPVAPPDVEEDVREPLRERLAIAVALAARWRSGAIRRLLEGAGGSSSELLDFSRMLRAPFEDEQSEILSVEEMADRWGGGLDPALIAQAEKLGMIEYSSSPW